LPVGLAVGAADQGPRACHSARGLTGRERDVTFRGPGTEGSNPAPSSGESRANLNESSRKPNSRGGPAALSAAYADAVPSSRSSRMRRCPAGNRKTRKPRGTHQRSASAQRSRRARKVLPRGAICFIILDGFRLER
jgi:hypothetical protein